jgi:hypothetical protein
MTGRALARAGAAHKLFVLDKAGDAAPPDIRNGPRERLGVSAGVNFSWARRLGHGKRRVASRTGISASPGRVEGRA